jgi:DNA helicase-2/ATP-dependent DNA helicase PcrA
MEGLNEYQQRAALPEEGTHLVLAGAGTGKTKTLVSRVSNILQAGKASPEEILVLTFSRRAVEELRYRSRGPGLDTVRIETFHSQALKLIRRFPEEHGRVSGRVKSPGILEPGAAREMVMDLVADRLREFYGMPLDIIIHLLKVYRDRGEAGLARECPFVPLRSPVINLHQEFSRYKIEKGWIEFDDLLREATDMLSRTGAGDRVREETAYLHVDEFQDVSLANMNLIDTLLSPGKRNLFAVGDDWQSIYGFRGARVDRMTSLPREVRDTRVHRLGINYRSFREIIRLSSRAIRKNRGQIRKNLRAARGRGGTIKIHEIDCREREVDLIEELVRKSGEGKSRAILCRNNDRVRWFRERTRQPVEIITMHGAKGLEFDLVIVSGIADGILPDPSAVMEEERRLFYVALSRARDELHLMVYRNEDGSPPLFAREIGCR